MTSKIVEWICPSCGFYCNKEPKNFKYFKGEGTECPVCGNLGMLGNKWIYDNIHPSHPQYWNREKED